MQSRGKIISPYQGEVLKILYSESAHIDPWETLFLVETKSGILEVISEYCGRIELIRVSEGDSILPGTILALIQCLDDDG